MGETMSDWIVSLRQAGQPAIAKRLSTNKIEDLEKLRKSGLPQFRWFDTSYQQFNGNNLGLLRFFAEHQGVCVRALPNTEGLQRDFTRKYKFGFLSFEDCLKFLRANIQEPADLWEVSLSEWEPHEYGFILQSGARFVRGEIGLQLDDLSHGKEVPLASFEFDRAGLGYISDKTKWLTCRNLDAKCSLWRAFSYIRAPWDNFDPICLGGYFEGVITKRRGEIKFIDYKTNLAYLT
jgi:hypothetical protein